MRAGETTPELVGVLVRARAATGSPGWKVLPSQPPRFDDANPRTAAPPAVGGTLRIAAFNVDNFFTTIADGQARCGPRREADECRGARSRAGFERQRAKLVAALLALDADVLALAEIENDGPVAVQALVDALDARAGPGVYARVADPPEGCGSDAVKVALIYRPGRVRPVGPARADTAAIHGRRPIAQAFEPLAPGDEGGQARFELVAVHLKSRRCGDAAGDDADRGDLQGCWSRRRTLQARAVREFALRAAAASGASGTLVVGDFNAYAQEDALVELGAHGFADQAERFDAGGYSFVFDGAAGRLDQVFADAAMAARVTGVAAWHIDADEPASADAATPYRASDHDPMLVGLRP